MKKTKMCRLLSLMVVLVCLLSVSTAAYAMSDPVDDDETESVEQVVGDTSEALTVEGNMTLVDDIDGEAAEDKQFITVVSKNGNYFYIIIDRATDGENTVHFLNQVDEADLLALMDEEEIEALIVTETATTTCICTDKCVAGAVNTNCPVCLVNMGACTGTEAETTPADEDTDGGEAEQKSSSGSMIIFVVLLVALGGGAFYYFKVLKNKPSVRGNDDLDDYGDEDEDDDEPDEEEYPDEDDDGESDDAAESEPDNDEARGTE